MSKQALITTTSTLVLAIGMAMVPVRQASAVFDYKGVSATECQPFLPTTYAEAQFRDNAIYNPTAVNQRVICPLNKDAFTTWAAGSVDLIAYFRSSTLPGRISCTVYGGGPSFGQPQVAYTVTSPIIAANTNSSIDFGSLITDPATGVIIEGWNVLCTLNPGMSLGGFFYGEDFDTDDTN